MKIHLVDELCGTGKSHWIFQQMKKWQETGVYENFVYISPLLSEVGGGMSEGQYVAGRIQEECPEMKFQYPVKVHGSKLHNVRHLIVKGENIAATHALFRLIDGGCREILTEKRNVLIIDEAVSAIESFDGISTQSLKVLLKGNVVLRDKDTGKLSWNHEDHPLTEKKDGGKAFEFRELVELCDSGYAYLGQDPETSKSMVIVWQYPKELLQCFTDVYVLTYMFEGSVMSSWAKMHGIEVVRVKPSLYKSTSKVKEELKDLVKVYEGRAMVDIGRYSLSQSFWRNAKDSEIEDITRKLSYIIKSKISPLGIKVTDTLVTCPKSKWDPETAKKSNDKSSLLATGRGYARAEWIPSNCKATNDYQDKRCLIYLINKYPNTLIANFCSAGGYTINPDMYAMAEAIQAIFRTCIRKKEPEVLHLIMASNRMRKLFLQWLNNEGVFSEE